MNNTDTRPLGAKLRDKFPKNLQHRADPTIEVVLQPVQVTAPQPPPAYTQNTPEVGDKKVEEGSRTPSRKSSRESRKTTNNMSNTTNNGTETPKARRPQTTPAPEGMPAIGSMGAEERMLALSLLASLQTIAQNGVIVSHKAPKELKKIARTGLILDQSVDYRHNRAAIEGAVIGGVVGGAAALATGVMAYGITGTGELVAITTGGMLVGGGIGYVAVPRLSALLDKGNDKKKSKKSKKSEDNDDDESDD
jgi:hypothetical protein